MPPRLQAAGLVLLAVLMWGCAPIGTRYLLGDTHLGLPAVPFVALRYTLATLFFLPALPGALRRWTRAEWGLGLLCGLIGVTGYNLPNALGSRTVSAGMVGLLNGVEPLMILLLLALRDRRLPGRWMLLAAAIGFAGILLLAHGAGPAEGTPAGIALVLSGALAWSVYCVLSPPLLSRRGAVPATSVAMLFGTLPMLALGLPGMPALAETMAPGQWEILLALVVGTSVIALIAWNAGSARLGAQQSGWFLYLIPVVSAGGGALILGEPITGVEYAGGALILLSVALSQKAR